MKNNVMEKLESKLMPIAQVISKNKYLLSVRDGFLISMPLLIVGSFFMLISNFPIQSWMNLLKNTYIFDVSVSALFSVVTNATFSLMAVFVVMGIGYNYAKYEETNKIFGAAVALMSWFMLMPMVTSFTPEGSDQVFQVSSIPLDWVGSKGIFVGILCAIFAVKIYKAVVKKGWVIRMPKGVPPTVGQSFAALLPIAIVATSFLAIHILFLFTPWGNAFEFVFNILQIPIQRVGDSLGAMLVIYLFAHILWLFGIHGTNITDTVFRPVLYTLSAANLVALEAGEPLPHIINVQFQDLFATYGGGGSTLSMLIIMFFYCKSKRIKKLGRLSILPSVFGINEPIIFGLPVVLNPVIAVPFVLVPMVNIVISYLCMSIGIVPICNGVIMPWTTPPIISGFLSSGWQGAILQIVLIALGAIIYLPFVKAMDNNYMIEEEIADQKSEDVLSSDDLSFD